MAERSLPLKLDDIDLELLQWPDDLRRRFEAVARELARREFEALRIYRPMPFQERFHACTAKEVLLRKANRVGGTLCGVVEDVRAVTCSDPYRKYPKKGTAFLLGWGEDHIGRTFYRMLCLPGAFTVIRSADGGWEPWNPNKPDHKAREEERVPAPPLLPDRFLKGGSKKTAIAYESRAKRVFKRIDLETGWELHAGNSAGDPNHAQGFNVDLCHIDEDTQDPGWYAELLQRTGYVGGKMRWTALPHGKNMAIVELQNRCAAESGKANPTSVLITATAYDNIYYDRSELAINEQIARRIGEDEYRKRILGEFTFESVLMYPMFCDERNGIDRSELPGGRVPQEWTRYLVIDPGHTPGTALFAAVSPPTGPLASIVLLYDELSIRGCDAEVMAREVKKKVDGEFAAWIIDYRGSRSHELGSGVRIIDHYEEAFARHGLSSLLTGYSFIFGSDNVYSRVEALRQWIGGPHERPRLRYIRGAVPVFVEQMARYQKKKTRDGIVLDAPEPRGIHAPICAEYLADYNPAYIPRREFNNGSPVVRVLREKLRSQGRLDSPTYYF
jgi:hypothetical protein